MTLRDALSTDAVRRADPVVVHGAHLLDRQVRRVHTSELVEAAALLRRGGLLLTTELDAAGLIVAGPDGALYPDDFFEAGEGEVTAYVPVIASGGGVVELPATTVAVLVHDGPFTDLDQTYGALGTIVAERGIGALGPIREHYLTPVSTEVCWPITIGTNR